jgi:hypothetical protein
VVLKNQTCNQKSLSSEMVTGTQKEATYSADVLICKKRS